MVEDPKKKLTDFITSGSDEPEQKTRIISKEQMAFTMAFLSAGEIEELDVSFMQREAEKAELLMMSYQGRRSDDVVEMTKGLDKVDIRAAGVQAIEAPKYGQKGSANPH